MKFERNKRISEEIKKVVSDLFLYEIKDPRLPALISVTSVKTTRDLRYTYIYVSVLGNDFDRDEVLSILNGAKGLVRREIGQKIKMHYTPEPIFRYDDSIESGMHIESILRGIRKESEGNE